MARLGGLPVGPQECRSVAKLPMVDASSQASTKSTGHNRVPGAAQTLDSGAYLRLVQQVQASLQRLRVPAQVQRGLCLLG
jgi:hypothetical protein